MGKKIKERLQFSALNVNAFDNSKDMGANGFKRAGSREMHRRTGIFHQQEEASDGFF